MTSTYCARFPRKIRLDARALIESSLARLQFQDRLARVRGLTRTLTSSEVGSMLFFLALILVTFLI